jgi:hypothetical protein
MLTFEERVHVQKVFNREIGEQKTAEFAVHLQESIDGLQSNNQAYVEEYRRMLAADHSVQLIASAVGMLARLGKLFVRFGWWLAKIGGN